MKRLNTQKSVTGLKDIQMATRESLRKKPFCMALTKDWKLRTSTVDLRETFTNLSWTRKHRKVYTVEREDLKNITQILSEEQLGDDGPVRILVQGTESLCFTGLLSNNRISRGIRI